MGFYETKPAFRQVLRPWAKRLAILSPDAWTWIAVGLSALAGWLLCVSREHQAVLLIVPVLLFLRLVLNVLDGVIAQESGLSSARGEALSEFTDRLSDLVILGGFAASGLGHPALALVAIIIVLLVSYVGILGKAVGAGRQYGGLMGKPDRMVAVIAACVAEYGAVRFSLAPMELSGLVLRPFDWASLAMIVLGFYTILFRLRAIFLACGRLR